jgi:holo-[acyl-carrier protein] synthase
MKINIKTGIDLVHILRLKELRLPIRERFLKRVFTDFELEEAGNNDAILAGKFAAKEAVAKTLGCGIGPVHWQDIEILHNELGQPSLRLGGNAETLADELKLDNWSVSISHESEYAVAVVIACSFMEISKG